MDHGAFFFRPFPRTYWGFHVTLEACGLFGSYRLIQENPFLQKWQIALWCDWVCLDLAVAALDIHQTERNLYRFLRRYLIPRDSWHFEVDLTQLFLLYLADHLINTNSLDVYVILLISLLAQHFPSLIIFDEPWDELTWVYRVDRAFESLAADRSRVVAPTHYVLMAEDLATPNGW